MNTKKISIIILFLAIIIFILFFGSSKEEIQCKIKGYSWVPNPGLCGEGGCGYSCDIKTTDAGKKCYSNNECEGACLCGNNESDSDGFQVGVCSKFKDFTEVSDCPCILENKSKTPLYPYGCS